MSYSIPTRTGGEKESKKDMRSEKRGRKRARERKRHETSTSGLLCTAGSPDTSSVSGYFPRIIRPSPFTSSTSARARAVQLEAWSRLNFRGQFVYACV